jgi:phosphate transport system protein
MARTVREMILLSVASLDLHDKNASAKLYQMDGTVDALYRKYLHEVIAQQNDKDKREMDPRCYISGLLILRYLERISDHACYISDSIDYILTGRSSPRR